MTLFAKCDFAHTVTVVTCTHSRVYHTSAAAFRVALGFTPNCSPAHRHISRYMIFSTLNNIVVATAPPSPLNACDVTVSHPVADHSRSWLGSSCRVCSRACSASPSSRWCACICPTNRSSPSTSAGRRPTRPACRSVLVRSDCSRPSKIWSLLLLLLLLFVSQ